MNEPLTWLVTGAAGGFGSALSRRILSGGHRLIATSRNAAALENLKAQGEDRVLCVSLDVTDTARVEAVIAEAASAFGSLDAAICNAGRGLVGALEELPEDAMRAVFETNFWGTVNVARAVLPVFRRQRSGHLVAMSAVAGLLGEPGFGIYAASKFAIEGLFESLRLDTEPLGIKITLVEPGPFRTPFLSRSVEFAESAVPDYDATCGKFAALLRKLDGRQIGDPDKAANRIVGMVEAGENPLRLMLGRFSFDRAKKKIESLTNDLETSQAGAKTEF